MKKFIFVALVFLGVFVLSEANDKLLLVQAVWRHGDRSPTTTFPSDPNPVTAWPQGWGQLTPLGMRQHIDLGNKLRKRYIENTDASYNIIPNRYKSEKIYVRSTDVNRTLISAMSNMIAMFPGGAGDFPAIDQWPKDKNGNGWVPIPIHTIKDDIDYTLNPDMDCQRQTELWDLVTKGPEYTKMQKDQVHLFDFLTKNTNAPTNDPVTPTNLWIIADALFIEKSNNKTLPTWANQKWENGTKTIYQVINETNEIVEYWNNGLNLAPQNNTDFSIEIPKIRGGSLLWSIIGHMEQKLYCLKNSGDPHCGFFNDLAYYAYSAHDTTLAALFSTLGFHMTNWNQDGYPHYSSCVTVELWQKPDNSTYVKFMYFPLNENMVEVTQSITKCGTPCTLENLAKRSEPYKPSPDARTLCTTSINKPSNTKASSEVPRISGFIILIFVFLFKN